MAHFLVGAALIIGMVEIPLYAYTLFDMTEIEGGLLLIRLTLMIPVGAVIGGWLADLVGYRITAVVGFLIAAGGYFLVSRWPIDPGQFTMTRDLMISGLGFGLVIGPIGASVTSSAGAKMDGDRVGPRHGLPHGGHGGGTVGAEFLGGASFQLPRSRTSPLRSSGLTA